MSINKDKKYNKEYLKIALGFTLSTLTTPLLNSVDTAIVGRLPNPVYIGGVALGGTIFNTIYWILGFLRVNTSGYSAKAFGMKEEEEEVTVLIRPMVISIIIGLLFLIFQNIILDFAINFYKADSEVTKYIKIYYGVLIWGAPFVLLNYTFLGWIMGRKQIRECLILQLVTNLVNIVLDIYFVRALDMNVEGVAYATLISQICTTLLSIFIILKGKKGENLDIFKVLKKLNYRKVFDKEEMKHICAVNFDLIIRTICLLTVTNIFMEESSKRGEIILAANSILFQIQYLISYFFDGFANSSSVFIGNGIGEKEKYKINWTIKKSAQICIVNSIIVSILFLFFGKNLIGLYTENSEILEVAKNYSIWLVIFPLVINAGLVFYGIFTGATFTVSIRNSMLKSLVLFLISYFIFVPIFQNNGVWLSFIVFSLSRSIFLVLDMKKLNKKINLEINK